MRLLTSSCCPAIPLPCPDPGPRLCWGCEGGGRRQRLPARQPGVGVQTGVCMLGRPPLPSMPSVALQMVLQQRGAGLSRLGCWLPSKNRLRTPTARRLSLSGVRSQWGSYAELLPVPERLLAAAPTGLSFEEAAAVPLVACTAWQARRRMWHCSMLCVRGSCGCCLRCCCGGWSLCYTVEGQCCEWCLPRCPAAQALDAAGLRPGQRVLVHAGAGGLGSMVVLVSRPYLRAVGCQGGWPPII